VIAMQMPPLFKDVELGPKGFNTFLGHHFPGMLRSHYMLRDASPQAISWLGTGRLFLAHAGTGWIFISDTFLGIDGESTPPCYLLQCNDTSPVLTLFTPLLTVAV
jgi:hypothetical protein